MTIEYHFILRDAQHVEWFLCMVPHFLERYVAHDVRLPFFLFLRCHNLIVGEERI